MNRQGYDETTCFFIGPEVEHTPAYSKRTLFVIGKQPLDQILRMAREYRTPHVFMGANHSFEVGNQDAYWDQTITALLDKGLWVTLDYQAHEHEAVLAMLNPGIWQSRIFVPLLGVRIPRVQTSSVNLTIKIDDVDFAATNAGVWCLHHHEITDSNRFTDWQEYTTDEILSPLAGPAEILPLKIPTATTVIPGSNRRDAVPGESFATPQVDPPLDLQKVKAKLEAEAGEVKNDQSLGLDPAPTNLKPDENEKEGTVPTPSIETPQAAAEAYAGSVETSDEVKTKEPSKKTKVKA